MINIFLQDFVSLKKPPEFDGRALVPASNMSVSVGRRVVLFLAIGTGKSHLETTFVPIKIGDSAETCAAFAAHVACQAGRLPPPVNAMNSTWNDKTKHIFVTNSPFLTTFHRTEHFIKETRSIKNFTAMM